MSAKGWWSCQPDLALPLSLSCDQRPFLDNSHETAGMQGMPIWTASRSAGCHVHWSNGSSTAGWSWSACPSEATPSLKFLLCCHAKLLPAFRSLYAKSPNSQTNRFSEYEHQGIARCFHWHHLCLCPRHDQQSAHQTKLVSWCPRESLNVSSRGCCSLPKLGHLRMCWWAYRRSSCMHQWLSPLCPPGPFCSAYHLVLRKEPSAFCQADQSFQTPFACWCFRSRWREFEPVLRSILDISGYLEYSNEFYLLTDGIWGRRRSCLWPWAFLVTWCRH